MVKSFYNPEILETAAPGHETTGVRLHTLESPHLTVTYCTCRRSGNSFALPFTTDLTSLTPKSCVTPLRMALLRVRLIPLWRTLRRSRRMLRSSSPHSPNTCGSSQPKGWYWHPSRHCSPSGYGTRAIWIIHLLDQITMFAV